MRKWITLVCLLLLIAALSACAAPAETPTGPAEDAFGPTDTQVTEETLPPVQITMPEYTLSYSGQFKDVISAQPHGDGSGLLFYVQLESGKVQLFDLFFNSQDGELVTMLTDTEGNRIPVAFQMSQAPEGLEQADTQLFYTAQEAVNEIVASLTLNSDKNSSQ